jgi:hypothetical protein
MLLGLCLSIGTATVGFVLFQRIFWLIESAKSIPELKDRLGVENEILKNLVQAFAGALLLAGLYFTWKNFYLAKEGLVTDRFNKAIDHLGDERMEVRLGGIYALARIARDSPRDHWSVMEILCAFLRTRAKTRESSRSELPTDLQSVLNVFRDRSVSFENDDQQLDLAKVDLRGADLKGAILDKVRFDDANLEDADFMKASLRDADFRGANLRNAHLREAALEGVNFIGANLKDASLTGASLHRAILLGAHLNGATLVGADLTGALYATKDQIASAIIDETTRMPIFLEVS